MWQVWKNFDFGESRTNRTSLWKCYCWITPLNLRNVLINCSKNEVHTQVLKLMAKYLLNSTCCFWQYVFNLSCVQKNPTANLACNHINVYVCRDTYSLPTRHFWKKIVFSCARTKRTDFPQWTSVSAVFQFPCYFQYGVIL